MVVLASAGDALNPTIGIMIANSLMGIAIVFCVLVFISFIISLFKYIPGSGAYKKKEKPEIKVEKPAVKAAAAPKASENLVNDAELVAVITAAIYAAEGAGYGAGSDPLIVRSIRRAR